MPFKGILITIVAAVLCGCGHPSQPARQQTAASQTLLGPPPHQRVTDDTARFLAGLPGAPGSPFSELEATDEWRQYRRVMDAAWLKADSEIIQGLTEFQRTELRRAHLEGSPLFYPFGGPDALTATLLFPRSPVYVMVALEPAGTLPTLKQLEKKHLAKYLGSVRNTMASELGRSFFVTREMDREFRGQVTDGLLVPILHLLVRTGHTILGFRYVRLNEAGQVEERPGGVPVEAEFANKGLDIEFRTGADQSVHRLFYFRVDLSDKKLRGNQGFFKYAVSLKGATTLLKATSYMTHHADFSMIRDLILSESAAILQDDSGIPYHCFSPGTWELQLYGDYTRPYGAFRWLEQPDLRKAYQAGGVKPLSLHVGYGFSRIASNLLLAKRLASAP